MMGSRGAAPQDPESRGGCKQLVALHACAGAGFALDHDAPAGTHPLGVQGLELPARR